MNRTGALTAAVVVHLVVSIAHGVVHAVIPVHIHGWQLAYVTAVLVLAPIVGLGLTLRGQRRVGGLVVLCTALGSITFEGFLHFVVTNPDHVRTVAEGKAVFAGTALLSTLGDLALLVVAVWFVSGAAQGGSLRPSLHT